MDFLYKNLVNEDVRIFPEVKPIQLNKLPIAIGSIILQKSIYELVYNLIFKEFGEQNIINLENQIDQLVYQLYNLTEEEIKIVESASNTKI